MTINSIGGDSGNPPASNTQSTHERIMRSVQGVQDVFGNSPLPATVAAAVAMGFGVGVIALSGPMVPGILFASVIAAGGAVLLDPGPPADDGTAAAAADGTDGTAAAVCHIVRSMLSNKSTTPADAAAAHEQGHGGESDTLQEVVVISNNVGNDNRGSTTAVSGDGGVQNLYPSLPRPGDFISNATALPLTSNTFVDAIPTEGYPLVNGNTEEGGGKTANPGNIDGDKANTPAAATSSVPAAATTGSSASTEAPRTWYQWLFGPRSSGSTASATPATNNSLWSRFWASICSIFTWRRG